MDLKTVLKKTLIFFEIMLIIFYSSVTIGFVLGMNNVLVKTTMIAFRIVIWPAGIEGFRSALTATILYYFILFMIPIAGYIVDRKHLKIHITLIILVLINLIEFFYGLKELATL